MPPCSWCVQALNLVVDELKLFWTQSDIYDWEHPECWYNSTELATVATSTGAFLIHALSVASDHSDSKFPGKAC